MPCSARRSAPTARECLWRITGRIKTLDAAMANAAVRGEFQVTAMRRYMTSCWRWSRSSAIREAQEERIEDAGTVSGPGTG